MMRAAAWITVIVLLSMLPLWAASVGARIDRSSLVLRDYNTWTGVLRLWKCEGWQSGNGTLTAWLNTCIEKFEKQHKGVYIQITDVSAETMRAFSSGALNPPDMIIYAPGMLEAPYDLIELPPDLPIRQNVSSLGLWQSQRYAAPIALGGYAVAVNRSLIGEIPSDWSGVQLEAGGSKKKEIFVFDAPADSSFKCWSAAVISLFAGSYVQSEQRQAPLVGEGMDIGLPTEKVQDNKVQHTQQIVYQNALPCVLPADFRTREGVYSLFTSGSIASMPVTQREIRRLQLLDESGKAPDWYVQSIGLPFTDQAALFSITARQGENMEQRQALSAEFMSLLLSEEMQMKLTQVRAFSVRDLPRMYTGGSGLSVIEEALLKEELLVSPAFGGEWRTYADSLMDGIAAGGQTRPAYERLQSMILSQAQQ